MVAARVEALREGVAVQRPRAREDLEDQQVPSSLERSFVCFGIKTKPAMDNWL
jgi:hypothetical protein